MLSGMWIYAYEWLSNGFDPRPAGSLFRRHLGFGTLGLLDDLAATEASAASEVIFGRFCRDD